MRALVCLTCLLLSDVAVVAEPNPPAFTRKPTARQVEDIVRIEFAVRARTDVEVAILDANGRIVRHLAAGVLGPNAPAPLEKGALTQELLWDGKDDYGQPAEGDPFEVRVAAGMRPKFEKFIGFNPAHVFMVRSLATGPGGTVYVYHHVLGFGGGTSHGSIVAFDRNGKYLRTVAPYAANLPEERLRGFRRVEIAPGVRAPFLYNAETIALTPGLGGNHHGLYRGIVAPHGRLAIMCVREINHHSKVGDYGTAQVLTLNTDGSSPEDGLLGTQFGKKNFSRLPSLALAPDGQTVYATGMCLGAKQEPVNQVLVFRWDDKEPRVLVGEGLNDPRTAAVDSEGNVHVADRGSGRVLVFGPDGARLGEFKTDVPEGVEVNPGTGEVYVLGGALCNEVTKYRSWRNPEVVARIEGLPCFRNKKKHRALMALDASAQPPVLWVAPNSSNYSGFRLLRLEDNGTGFSTPQDILEIPGNDVPSAGKATDPDLSGNRLFMCPPKCKPDKPQVFDVNTGKPLPFDFPRGVTKIETGFDFAAGKDGNLYFVSGWPNAWLMRMNRNGVPLAYPVDDGKRPGLVPGLGNPRVRHRGIFVDHEGRSYVLQQVPPNKKRFRDANIVSVYDRDGKLIRDRLIDSDLRHLNSVKADPAGNVYLAVGLRPGNDLLPPHLEGKVPAGEKDPDADCGYNYYPLSYGSIVKFGPEGGQIRLEGEGQPANLGYGLEAVIKGAKYFVPGASLVPSWLHIGCQGATPNICMCESPRIDVDNYGRCFFPDACAFRVGVLDTAGNLICRFGAYGNQDSGGPGSAIPEPDIPIGWVSAVTVGEGVAYVGDRLNRRVIVVRLEYGSEERCPILGR